MTAGVALNTPFCYHCLILNRGKNNKAVNFVLKAVSIWLGKRNILVPVNTNILF
jgi:hypothetical protein